MYSTNIKLKPGLTKQNKSGTPSTMDHVNRKMYFKNTAKLNMVQLQIYFCALMTTSRTPSQPHSHE